MRFSSESRAVPFLSGLTGMALGLVIDCASIPAEALASLCSVPGSWQATLALHWRTMPASNAFMLIAALLAIAREKPSRSWSRRRIGGRTCAHALCLVTMMFGMAVGASFGGRVAGIGLPSFAALAISMGLGMPAGMLLSGPPAFWAAKAWPLPTPDRSLATAKHAESVQWHVAPTQARATESRV